jgi:hypothetical protein
VTAVSYRDSRTDSIRLSPIREIQQKATAGPTAVTNRIYRGSSNNRITASLCFICIITHIIICICRDFFLRGSRGTRTPKHFVNLTGKSKIFKCWKKLQHRTRHRDRSKSAKSLYIPKPFGCAHVSLYRGLVRNFDSHNSHHRQSSDLSFHGVSWVTDGSECLICEVVWSFTDESSASNLIEWQYFNMSRKITILHHHSRKRSVK